MDLANASLLDEATAAAEAMALLPRVNAKGGDTFFVDADCHPQTIEVVRTRAEPLGIDVVVGEPEPDMRHARACSACCCSTRARAARSATTASWSANLHAQGTLVAVATDLLALVLLTPPGEWGADVVVGSAQRFGVPLGFGGPHAAFIATREEYKRNLPGRLVGVSVDAAGRPRAAPRAADPRAAHPAREGHQQHLHRAGAAGDHRRPVRGVPRARRPPRHRRAGARAHARRSRRTLRRGVVHDHVLRHHHGARARADADASRGACATRHQPAAGRRRHARHRARRDDDHATVARRVCARSVRRRRADRAVVGGSPHALRPHVRRSSPTRCSAPTTPRRRCCATCAARRPRPRARPHDDPARLVHDEAQRDRRDDADHVARLRRPPPVRADRAGRRATPSCSPTSSAGCARSPATTRSRCSPTPGPRASSPACSRSAATTPSRGEDARTVCLIPESAHGTNAASAVMAGMRVVVVKCDDDGNVDLDDLKAKAHEHAARLAALMVTYPSTHGVYEAQHPRRVRGRARVRRAGVPRRRQPQRARRPRQAGQVRRRRVAPEPAQDVLHPPRWGRAGRRPGGGARAPGAVPAAAHRGRAARLRRGILPDLRGPYVR